MRCGLHPAEFWELTPREITDVVDAHGQRMLDALDIAIAAVWRGAALTAAASVGKLPDLEKVMHHRRRPGSPPAEDEALTRSELVRWSKLFAERAEREKAGK